MTLSKIIAKATIAKPFIIPNARYWLEKARKLPEAAENVLNQINKIEDYQKENEQRHEELISTLNRERRGTKVLIFITLVVFFSFFLFWTIK